MFGAFAFGQPYLGRVGQDISTALVAVTGLRFATSGSLGDTRPLIAVTRFSFSVSSTDIGTRPLVAAAQISFSSVVRDTANKPLEARTGIIFSTWGGVTYPFIPQPYAEPGWTGRYRRKQRWYECQRCGVHYPEEKMIVQRGLMLCHGPGTVGCVDEPGYAAARRRLVLPIEEKPRPLAVDDEEL